MGCENPNCHEELRGLQDKVDELEDQLEEAHAALDDFKEDDGQVKRVLCGEGIHTTIERWDRVCLFCDCALMNVAQIVVNDHRMGPWVVGKVEGKKRNEQANKPDLG